MKSEPTLDVEYELRKDYPTIKFLEALLERPYIWSPNYTDYFLINENFNIDKQVTEFEVSAAFRFEITTNTYLSKEDTDKHFLHLNYICSRTDFRGCGALSLLSKIFIEEAEKSGIFIWGHSRPFFIELPKIINHHEAEAWLKRKDHYHNNSLKEDKKNAKSLLQVYLDQGFCRYNQTGVRFTNRFWKKMGFGYRSNNIKDRTINKFLDETLKC
jgi:hypothetical protein